MTFVDVKIFEDVQTKRAIVSFLLQFLHDATQIWASSAVIDSLAVYQRVLSTLLFYNVLTM